MLFSCIVSIHICLERGCLSLAFMASVVISEDGDIAARMTVIVIDESVQYFVS